MELIWVVDFLALVRTGSFTEAAKVRNSSQSAFSRRIQSLESWVGVRLVDRAVIPVELTSAGRDFLPLAKDFQEKSEETKFLMSSYKQ